MDDILYADIYEDVKNGKIKDPRPKPPPLPPKPGTAVNANLFMPQTPPKRPAHLQMRKHYS